MTTLTELKQQADHLGLAPEMVRLYGDLRLKATWEKALIANKTITVEAVEVEAEEIIPFTDDEDDKWFTKELELVYLAIPQDHPISFQEIFAKTNLPSGELSLKLLDLELAEMVIQEPKGFYSQLHDEYDKYLGFTVGDQVEAKCCYAFLNKGDEGFVPMIIKQIFFESNNLRFRVQRIDDEKTGFYCGIDAIRLAVDCPPPPPPPIARPCPTPEIPKTIPGIEIAERESPVPGHGRGDERLYPDNFNPNIGSIAEKATKFRALLQATYPGQFDDLGNLGDRLLAKIKEDIGRWFEAITEDLKYCLDVNYLDISHYQEARSIVEIMQWNIENKHSIYDIWSCVPYFHREGFEKLIPFGIHDIFKAGTPPVDCWECKREAYWLVIEKYSAIPTLADDFGGVFIPNKFHELGNYIYVWKFPGMIQAENFFHHITDAKKYCMIPANSQLKINKSELLGV